MPDPGLPGHRRPSLLLLAAFSIALALPRLTAAESLLVRTVDPATGGPVAGAFVMIGPAPDQPFAGNSGTTGPSGAIVFTDPALTTPAIVTAGTVDRAYVTITASPADSVVVPLPPRARDAGVPPPVARVTGTAPGIQVVNNDGFVEMGFVLPALDVDVLLGSGQAPFSAPPDTVDFPIIGETVVPGIVVIPDQTELFVFNFGKPEYRIDLPDGSTQSLFCPAGRISLTDLANLGAGDPFEILNALEIRRFGIERDAPITDGAVIDVHVDLPTSTPVTVQFAGVPAGHEISIVSGATIPGPAGAGDRYVLFDGAGELVDASTALSAASMPPAGDMSDAAAAVIAMYADTSSTDDYLNGIVERGFVPPINLAADTFFLVPDVTQDGGTVTFTDPLNPGVSPAATWAAGVFALAGDSGDPAVVEGIHWRVIAPAVDLGFTLPTLPPSAPPAVPDPSTTPGDDRLELTLTATNHSGDAQAVLGSVVGDASHFVLRTIAAEPPASGVDVAATPAAARQVLGLAYPDPARVTAATVIKLTVVSPVSGHGEVQIYTAAGRLVRAIGVDTVRGIEVEVRWDGRDARGRALPPGTYFARLKGVRHTAEKLVLIR